MKGVVFISVLLALAFAAALLAQAQPPTDLRALDSQAYKLAEELLDGRPIVLRVFRDWHNKPEAFETVSVLLQGLVVELDSLKAALGQNCDSAFVVAIGSDQTDKPVAAAMGDYIFGRAYKDGQKLHIWPPRARDPGHKWWTFVDALGNPIPQAKVEILLHDCDSRQGARVSVGKVQLDEQGRLKRIRETGYPIKFIFTLSHPNYGTAMVEYAGCPSVEDAPKTYVVPLVRRDSEPATRSVEGFVVDGQGSPIEGAQITSHGLRRANGGWPGPTGRLYSRSITDKEGWFAVYTPLDSNAVPSELVPAGSQYLLSVAPPRALNLRACEGQVCTAGTQVTIVLTAMEGGEYFHTFAFEDANVPITDPAELKKITITLFRDNREWMNLNYDQWSQGAELLTGKLLASTTRWGNHFTFEPIELTPDSPENLVFRARSPIIYRGRVVNGQTGEPMPGVLVLVDHKYLSKDPSALKPDEWNLLRAQAVAEASKRPRDTALYERLNRVTLTDVTGSYEIVFMPGFDIGLWNFGALEKGYTIGQVSTSHPNPNAEGIVEVQTIKLFPAETAPPYFPQFVFEDETGPVTDPQMLGPIRITVKKPDGGIWTPPTYDYWLNLIRRFVPGWYYAEVDWNGKHYVFEPVDLTKARPPTVTFKPKKIIAGQITFRGRVVDGITGEPIQGAVVMYNSGGYDASDLDSEQWLAIHALGQQFDPNDSALVPLRHLFGFAQIARVDSHGWFKVSVPRARRATNMHDTLTAIEKDYLAAEQQLEYLAPTDATEGKHARAGASGSEPNEFVAVPAMKLFPAGTILVEPNLPDFGFGDRQDKHIRLHWYPTADDVTPWLKEIWGTSGQPKGARSVYKYELQPNQLQSAYIPALLALTIRIYSLRDNERGYISIPGIRLQQGQVLDLGRRDFPRAVQVVVKVVNSAGQPVKGVGVNALDEDGHLTYAGAISDQDGLARIGVPPNSKGQFAVWRIAAAGKLQHAIPYQVAGQEDAGKEFTLQLSDEILSLIFK
jgi:hypothetical protein